MSEYNNICSIQTGKSSSIVIEHGDSNYYISFQYGYHLRVTHRLSEYKMIEFLNCLRNIQNHIKMIDEYGVQFRDINRHIDNDSILEISFYDNHKCIIVINIEHIAAYSIIIEQVGIEELLHYFE